MIEHDVGIDGPAALVERRLEITCALVHALIARPASEQPAERAEALALFEQLTLPAAVFDAKHEPRLTNEAWRALLGGGASFPRTHLDAVIRTGATIHLAELELELESCVARCAATVRPIFDGAGATTGSIVVCTVIADALVSRELAVSADALVWGGPVYGDPDYFNSAWGAYTCDARRFARLYAWKDAIHPDDRASCVQAFDEASGRGRAAEVEARVRRADGEYRWHRIRFVMAPGSRWYAVATNIEQARAEADRAELLAREHTARAESEQVHHLQEQFLAAVSHELRAPLATMLRWEAVLRDETADVAVRAQALAAIHESALSQARLVDELLDASRVLGGKLDVDLRPLDLEGVLREALEAVAPAARVKQIVLDRRGARVLADVQADAARLRQVLHTLLANAVKFAEPGGNVTVTIARQERSISIEVADSGCGIAPDRLPRVFEPFSQIHHASGREGGGLGLGLAIAKQIAVLHQGDLTAASGGPGRGATFTLRLPIADERRARSASSNGMRR
ncbi:MAG TPA: PAS domain-containing sensor histidine kinase [Kofleriaceae bacterium]|nr:PAS domain-containing sensor histidine kinase [Kofleriaceae bacterium]